MDQVFKRKQDIVTANMNGETVMMDIRTGKYYNIGSVGGRIWELLETPMTYDALVEKLTSEYDVAAKQCRIDIAPFMEKLVTIGLLVKS